MLAGLAVLAAWPGAARSATNDDEDPAGVRPPPRAIDQEIIGVELPLVSGILSKRPAPSPRASPRVEAGAGLAIRVARHRWEHAYYTPIAVGLFLASDTGYRCTR